MAFNRPSRLKLITDATADLSSRLSNLGALLRRSNLNIIARMLGGFTDGLYGYIAWAYLQLFVDTCDDDVLPRHASLWGVPRLTGSFASYPLLFTGTTGAIVSAGTQVQRADGVIFATSVDTAIVAGQAVTTVTSLTVGALGVIATGSTLQLVAPVSGVIGQGTVQAGGSDGVDAEAISAWRARIKARVQAPPHGGAINDYIMWAKQVPGVTRVWPLPQWLGAGTVGIAFAMDNAPSAPIPDANTVAAVQANINLPGNRPVTAQVTAFAMNAYPVNYQIQNVAPSAQAAVIAALQAMHAREANFEDGTGSGILLKSHIDDAIQLSPGVTDHVLTSPNANIAPPKGSIATFGSVTWL